MDRGNLSLAPRAAAKRPRSEDAPRVKLQPPPPPEVEAVHPVTRGDARAYERGARADLSSSRDKKAHRETKQAEKRFSAAAAAAAAAEMLLPSSAGFMEADGPMERTYRVSQRAIASAVDVGVARKGASFTLDTFGPYTCAYSKSGRHLLLGGAKGHVAVVDWNTLSVKTELNLGESVHAVTFLHDHTLFATAQRKYAYIYDASSGAEVHVLRHHVEPLALEFLPYHFLLASIGATGFLKYQDVSTGSLVAEHRTKLGSCSVLRQNPWNAVLCAGHSNGVVTMWTPNVSTPVAKLVAHRAPVTALAVDPGGRYLISAGGDSRLKVWDVRRWREVHDYFTTSPAHALDVSQRGLCAVGFRSHVQVWGREFALEDGRGRVTDALLPPPSASAPTAPAATEGADGERGNRSFAARAAAAAAAGVSKAAAPYMKHELPGCSVVSLRFRPYDDFLAVGHSKGLASLIVPGSGEPNFDSLEADPFQGKKARQEAEVHALLDKIPPSMITLDPGAVARVDAASKATKDREAAAAASAAVAAGAEALARITGRKRRGIRKALKRQANIITEQRLALIDELKAQKEARRVADAEAAAAGKKGGAVASEAPPAKPTSALSRFFNK